MRNLITSQLPFITKAD